MTCLAGEEGTSQAVYALRFLKEFIIAPGDVGALTPSSKELAAVVVREARVSSASVVVEFGPGTGAITEVLINSLKPDAKFIAIEINHDFYDLLRRRFPSVNVVRGSAVDTPKFLSEIGEKHCDAIVSGLPWTFFKEKLQDELLDAAVDSLRPGGMFATYIYVSSLPMPSSVRFRNKLRRRYSKTGMTHVIWKNVPPAIVVWGEK